MTRGRLIIAALIVALLGAAALTRGYSLFAPRREAELALNGNVDIRQVDLGFRIGGRIASIIPEEGARVQAGDILATLDTRPLRDQLAADEAQIASASAQLEKQRNGNRPQDIAQSEANVAQQRASLVKAKADYDRRSELVRTGAVSRADFDATRSQYESAVAQVRSAEEALSLQRAGARAEDIRTAEAQRAQAIAQAAKTRTDLADAELRAPHGGVILTRAREPGAIVQGGETLLTLTAALFFRSRSE